MNEMIAGLIRLGKALGSLDAELRESFVCERCGKPTSGITQGVQSKADTGLCACPAELKREKQVKPFPYRNSNPATQEADIRNGMPEEEGDATGEP